MGLFRNKELEWLKNEQDILVLQWWGYTLRFLANEESKNGGAFKMDKKRPINKLLVFLMGTLLCGLTFHGTGMATPITDYDNNAPTDTGLKIASGGLTLIYFPVKAAYAGLGGIVGGIAYVLGGGDEETAQVIWTPTIKGTYQITPDHLKGERPVRFFGQADFGTMY